MSWAGKRVIVVGGTSGIGEQLVLQLLEHGAQVATLGRRADRLATLGDKGAITLQHDVKNRAEVPELFFRLTQSLGGLDTIIYCAGVMTPVDPSEFNTAKDEVMVEVNVTGAMAWLNIAAERFQGVGAGQIVGISSVAGDRGRQGQPGYNTTKAALNTYLEALRNRLSRSGVTVCTIKPGPTATEMTASLNLKGMMSAPDAARIILSKAHVNGEVYLKLTHRVIFAVIRAIPSPIFRRLKL